MWRKDKFKHFVDSKLVTKDFIVAEGSTYAHNFLDKDSNPFHKDLSAPIFYIFKVHRNHPMKILSSNINHVDIYPAKELKNKNRRMPAKVFEDKKDYDLTTFLLLPFDIDNDKIKPWEKFYIRGGFINNDNEKLDACLLYLKHGASLHSQDDLKISEIIPSQLFTHFYSWLLENKKIYSHKHTFNRKLEGRTDIRISIVNGIIKQFMPFLEERYKTRLIFDDLRKYCDKGNI